MAIVEYIQDQTRKARRKQFQKGKAEGLKQGAEWNQRRLQAEERGEPFNEPFPGDEEPNGCLQARRIQTQTVE